jgi:hypothetical protein
VREYSGIALQSFLGLLFKELAEILRFWQGGVNRNGTPKLSRNHASRYQGNPTPYSARASECRSLTPSSLTLPLYCNDGSKFERKILQTLAGFQFDFDLLLLGFHPEPGPLGAIPGQWPGRAIYRLVIRDRARKQPIFTGRKVVECETPIISRQHFGITQNFICKSRIDRRQMHA